MYLILVYDVNVERVSKVNKYLKRFLVWIQNSVFEGEIRESTYETMVKGLLKIIKNGDKVIIYKLRTENYLERIMFGNQNQDIKTIL
jgi:CRISPR-associated protein Cas2